MPNIIDSYSESNQDRFGTLPAAAGGGGVDAFGQCFTGDGEKIVAARWFLAKNGAPPGNIVAKIYSMTGTFGTDGTAGTLLATSDNVAASTLSNSAGLITFAFSGANQYVTANGTHYVVTVEYPSAQGGNSTNFVLMGYDNNGTHPGTWCYFDGAVFQPLDLGIDLCFYVDGVPVNVTFNVTGVAATPAIGVVTVQIGGVVPPPVVVGAGGGRLIPPLLRKRIVKRVKVKYLPRVPEAKRVRIRGVKASAKVGKVSFNTSFPVTGLPDPVSRVNGGEVKIGFELSNDEIIALLSTIK